MKVDKINRRLFLQGAGGLLVTLPGLTSILGEAYAEASVIQRNKRFLLISSRNQLNPYWLYSVKPSELTIAQGYRYKQISDVASVSPMLGSQFQKFASKLSLIRGLNLNTLDHHLTAILGNLAGCNIQEIRDVIPMEKTIDVVMAEFQGKKHSDILKLATIHGTSLSSDGTHKGQEGGLPLTLNSNPFLIYQTYFTNLPEQPTQTGANPRRKLVDMILQDTKASLLNKTYLSSTDRDSVNSHLDYLTDLEKRYAGTAQTPTSSCVVGTNNFMNANWTTLDSPASAQALETFTKDIAILMAEAVKCNVFSLGNFTVGSAIWNGTVYNHRGNGTAWHGGLAHGDDVPGLTGVNEWILRHVYKELLERLDVEETSGVTFLDNSIVAFTPENSEGHANNDMALILAGKGGGTLEAGRYWDFGDTRFPVDSWMVRINGVDQRLNLPMPYNRFWNGILQSWGMKPLDYEIPGRKGYGNSEHLYKFKSWSSIWPDIISANLNSYYADVGKPLPGLFKISA